jgi:hypothetical protein
VLVTAGKAILQLASKHDALVSPPVCELSFGGNINDSA